MLNYDEVTLVKWTAPLFKTPITDVFFHVRNLQCLKECAHYELQLIDCMEAYGYHKGKEKCRLILSDMYECGVKFKRAQRVMTMMAERDRQLESGEKKEYAKAPPLDVY
ncbi:NADH dehydrogenase [ubiquinone] iron-sulfur protein 5 [Linepithema humile]|uniref:NADH dehydrogenase [ubiquinone] iron-sulfur protein 5 n=1 Tax=Linepithema humile TaxID=83485 RepID=UPI000623A4A1|nr:PREDICTED: uncharacterized protein LOC105672018 [Linepithema humile]